MTKTGIITPRVQALKDEVCTCVSICREALSSPGGVLCRANLMRKDASLGRMAGERHGSTSS